MTRDEGISHDEMRRRGTPFLPLARDQLAYMESEGVIVVTNQDQAEKALIGWLLGCVDGFREEGLDP